MRILHTGDWHLGRLFYGQHLTEDQAYVLEKQFFPLLKDEKIDAIIIAGDIFDRAVPPEDALALWNDTLKKVAMDYKIPTIVIGGNHDSGARMNYGSPFFAMQNLWMEGTVREDMKAISLADEYGEVFFCPIPYMEPQEAAHALGENIRWSYDEAYGAMAEYFYSQIPTGARSVAISHAFVVGSHVSESERPLSVGGSDQVGRHHFAPFSYTALGHIHKPQEWSKIENSEYKGPIRYSGSLLKYSFDEAQQKKSFTIVDLGKEGVDTLYTIPVEARRDVRCVKGYFEDILEGRIVGEEKQNPEDYIMAEILDETPVINGMERLRRRYPNAMALELTGRIYKEHTEEKAVLKKVEKEDLFKSFFSYMYERELTEEENSYINSVWDHVNKEV